MGTIKKTLLKAADGLPRMILRPMLERKVKESGVDMPHEVIDALADHLLSRCEEPFVWDDGSADGERQNLALKFTAEDAAELEAQIAKATDAMPEAMQKANEYATKLMFQRLRERWPDEHTYQQFEVDQFRANLEDRWSEGLMYLRMLLTGCREVGQETATRHHKSRSKRHRFRRWVLLRLHARACQVTDEIICLMENGFADGAMARWRTLHELSVVASLIGDGDEDLAERYMLHDTVELMRQADDFDATQVPLGYAPISKRERGNIERNYRAVIERFGPSFATPYGWAAKHLDHKKPTFKQLQVEAGRGSMSSYYKMASFNVHAGARSLFFNLTSMGDEDVLIAGRSNAGLADPGENTAQSLLLITGIFAGATNDLDRLAKISCLLNVRDKVGPALHRAALRLRRDDHTHRNRRSKKQHYPRAQM